MVERHSSVSNLQQIANLYQQVDNYLETLRDKVQLTDYSSTNWDDAIDRKQEINDQAYFVLAWGQLETEIEEACRSVIEEGQSHSNWNTHRVWMLFNLGNRRLSGLRFEDRLSLVLEKGGENWKRTMKFYQIRNQIAHGKLLFERIDVSEAIQEFFNIRLSLAWN